ncbi:MAG TPA: biosynthetic peptidoglycan transglycosylase [Polyangiaceae bacterium]
MRLYRLVAGTLLAAVIVLAGIDASLPGVSWLATTTPPESSFMRWTAERAGKSAGAYSVEPVGLEAISPWLVCAVLKSEDRMFFRHHGFDWVQVRRAAGRVARGERTGGASTLSQQLARNVFLTPERSALRKIREALLTDHLESALSKRRILELYLNLAEWGDGTWGAEQAARAYFGTPASELGPFEATFLASLLPAPCAPLRDAQVRRQGIVQDRALRKLLAAGLLERAQYERALVRGEAVRARLAAGEAPARALEETRSLGPAPGPSPSLQAVLSSECGLDAELADEAKAAGGD